ncbi:MULTISPECIES: phosphoribosylanthranilate isomerase [Streptomyces]|uniref:N-(5'-phosphoribosyl)anthranilate isomerase n=2 Tax=Streptomyces TaxID=1883 RepID=A0A1D8G8U3_9ACTN|nr:MULTISPECIES: phosphoribosylanthranilate isomerase [Streptomyces]AOT61838.1 N-(5'-phosphoribosyl)anthranilate isomerase [Streptomyces rubrolavendulae]KAF0646067.1 N-(5'-phosphoribosyl)anthranilate isomerase [Streptomyces fradiae ATCC 10745 = DSM 40063]OSY50355.1 N-(5'-phosphoribosyl)anthranilate isomerase [Streptomyces fradiae ATCC 10745 = DSM 40063]QEV14748.1 phosphoribosylanthranilate isomerase [Streptomyces fradiae ATCC 10745 = DSM 40063]UQS29569.1 phosphoribosylanthranilate isomerase [S
MTEVNKLVQVAGIIDAAEADLCIGEGADWLGFALRLPSGKDDIPEQDAAAIIKGLEAPHAGVLISYLTDAEEVSRFCDELGVVAVQLHGDVETEQLRLLKELRPELFVLKSLVVKEDNADELLKLVDDTHPFVDMYITDTFDPKTGAKGATGLTHDWNVSAELVRRSPKPLMMAGGLNPENVYDAIRTVKPAAVDAHTGLEGPDGRKDRAKVAKFVAEARRAFDEIG